MKVCIECKHCKDVQAKDELSMRDRYRCLRTAHILRHEVTGETMNVSPMSCVTARSRPLLCGIDGRFFERNTEPERRAFRRTVCEDLLLFGAFSAGIFAVAYVLHFFGVITL